MAVGAVGRGGLTRFQNSATGVDLGFHAARSYSLMRLPKTGRRWIRSWEGSAGGWPGRAGAGRAELAAAMGAPSVAASLVLTKGQLAIDVCSAAHADRISFDFACDDAMSGNCRQLREFFEASNQAYVLRVPSNFVLTLASGPKLTRAQAVGRLLKDKRRWEVRSAGSGSKGELVCPGLDRRRQPAP